MATKAQREARRQISEQNRIVIAALKSAFRVSRSMMAQAGRLWRQQIDPGPAVGARAIEYEPSLFDAMVTAHANARFDALVRAAKSGGVKVMAIPGLQGEAVKFVEDRAALTAEQVAHINLSYGEQAATLTGGVGTELERRVSVAFAQATEQGLTVRDGSRLIGQAFADAGVAPSRAYLLETIYRTQTATAYAAGRWQANQDPAIQDILWGYEYSTAGDDRVRLEHEALDGVTLPKDDPRWATIAVPNGFNCRCTLIELYDTDEHDVVTPPTDVVEIEGEIVTPGPDARWKVHPLNSIGESPILGTTPAVGEAKTMPGQ